MPNISNSINGLLLDLLSNALFDTDIDVDINDIDLSALFKEALSQTVATVVFDKLPENAKLNDPETYSKWELYALKSVQHNMAELFANAKLENLFKNADIPICTIKGFACAAYYPDQSLRQMGDIDFIIPKEKMHDGKSLMTENGFVCVDEEEEHDFHIGFKKNGLLYEMHDGITAFLDNEGNIEKYLSDITKDTSIAEFGFAKLIVPNVFIHGLIMLLHMQRHMISGGGIGLRHLCDWAVFVNSISNDEWISLFEEKLKKIHVWEFARALSKVSEIYLHMPQKAWFADYDAEISEELLNDMIVAGNFGYKDIKRYQELAFVSRDVNHKGKLLGFFNSYVNKVYSWKPVFKKHKVLLPFGMVAYPFRIAFLVIFKNKKVNLTENYKEGQKRSKLHDRLFK